MTFYIKREEDKWTQNFNRILFHKSKDLLTSRILINQLIFVPNTHIKKPFSNRYLILSVILRNRIPYYKIYLSYTYFSARLLYPEVCWRCLIREERPPEKNNLMESVKIMDISKTRYFNIKIVSAISEVANTCMPEYN